MRWKVGRADAWLAAIALLSGAVSARCDGPAYVDPAKAAEADPDFAVQGEYVGMVSGEEGDEVRIGLQLIALGHGSFRGVAYTGGLPGDGWDGGETAAVEGRRSQRGPVELVSEEHTAVAAEGEVKVYRKGEQEAVGTLRKVERRSPTLGMRAPQGAMVLFDGSSLEHWRSGAEMTDRGLLREGATTAASFGDHRLHIEFRLPYMPLARGQGRGNSGLYLLERYEVQMLDSFGLNGADDACGALYGLRAPDVNMCYPPLMWQTYDIEFTAPRFDEDGRKIAHARVTVRHNGVVIHDDVEVPRGTGSAAGRPERPTGPHLLQDHGDPVRYRNIWVVEKP